MKEEALLYRSGVPGVSRWEWGSADRLGSGGYSKVYRGKHSTRDHGAVAIKVFNNKYSVETFEREVDVLKALRNVERTPVLLDYGRDEQDRLCIVTELISGEPLDRLVQKNGPLGLAAAKKMLQTLLSVLEKTHANGIVHTDIQAPNVMVSEGEYTLIDWGVSRDADGKAPESVAANKATAAPEFFHGRCGIASDFYSLAWTFIFAATGKWPYHRAQLESIQKRSYSILAHCFERPILPEEVPEAFHPLLYNWLSKEPEHRLVGYDLGELMRNAEGRISRALEHQSFAQLSHEFSFDEVAARQGVRYCQYHLALDLFKSSGREAEAIYWLRQASDQGMSKAMVKLATSLEKKPDVSIDDREEAVLLLRQAADLGNAQASYLLWKRLESYPQWGGEQESVQCLTAAAEGGYRDAQYYRAMHLLKEGESSRARCLLRKSAEQGYEKSLDYFREALGISEDNLPVLYNIVLSHGTDSKTTAKLVGGGKD